MACKERGEKDKGAANETQMKQKTRYVSRKGEGQTKSECCSRGKNISITMLSRPKRVLPVLPQSSLKRLIVIRHIAKLMLLREMGA